MIEKEYASIEPTRVNLRKENTVVELDCVINPVIFFKKWSCTTL